MKIKSIQLSWFRGAADPISLETDCKSVVVYGVNASGKSSFVDAIEYVLNNGRIGHLSHEYSGKHQEKGVPNTHKPKGKKIQLEIKSEDESVLKAEIMENGSHSITGAETAGMDTWDYRRTVLRQDEVSKFIHNTKGEKYSALLPLLGLHEIEIAAENLRQLAKSILEQQKFKDMKADLKRIELGCKKVIGTDYKEKAADNIELLRAIYCPEKVAPQEVLSLCDDIEGLISTRFSQSSKDQRRHLVLQSAADIDIKSNIDSIRSYSAILARAVEPLIAEKLTVLESAEAYTSKLEEGQKEVKCPACGSSVPVENFQTHVKAENERLRDIIDTFEKRNTAIGDLCDDVRTLKTELDKADVKSWKDKLDDDPFADYFTYLDSIDTKDIRKSCSEEDLKLIEKKLLPLIEAAKSATKDAPSDV